MKTQFLLHTTVLVFSATLLAGNATASDYDDCRKTRTISEEIDLSGISAVSIEAGAGKLTVIGRAGITSAQLNGVACAKREDDLAEIAIETSRDGSTLSVRTLIPKPAKSFMGNNYARLHLEVGIPDNLTVEIVDSSGSMVVRNVASVEISDGSGSINIKDVAGLVNIVEDGSGSISALRTGSVRIEQDGSGSINVERTGSVRIEEDGSGSITASMVINDVYVGRDGSGSITAEDVGGSFTVVRDSGGDIRHSNVGGVIQIDN